MLQNLSTAVYTPHMYTALPAHTAETAPTPPRAVSHNTRCPPMHAGISWLFLRVAGPESSLLTVAALAPPVCHTPRACNTARM